MKRIAGVMCTPEITTPFFRSAHSFGDSGKESAFQFENLDGACRILFLQQVVAKDIERAFAKIIGSAAVEFLLKFGVVVERGFQSLRSILFSKLLVESHGARPAVMASVAPHVHGFV